MFAQSKPQGTPMNWTNSFWQIETNTHTGMFAATVLARNKFAVSKCSSKRIHTRDPTQRSRRRHRRSTQTPKMATTRHHHRPHPYELQAAIPPANEASLQFQARPKPSLQDPIPPCSTFPTIFGSFCTSDSLHVLAGAVPLLTLWRPPCGMCSVRSLTSKERFFSWAATRICRPGRARVITNNRLVDLNIENLFRVDDGRIEVVANGLPMWGS